jgi:hypothetical protein
MFGIQDRLDNQTIYVQFSNGLRKMAAQMAPTIRKLDKI